MDFLPKPYQILLSFLYVFFSFLKYKYKAMSLVIGFVFLVFAKQFGKPPLLLKQLREVLFIIKIVSEAWEF